MELENAWFDDPVCFKTQTEACSYGKVTIGKSTQGTAMGVTTVNITQTVNGMDDGVIRDAVSTARLAIYPNSGSVQFPGRGSADYVVYCLPPGTGDWVAYAYLNYWLSVYNGNYW